MTAEEAKQRQNSLAEHFDLSYWYGIHCDKCCGVYPKLVSHIGGYDDLCRYECEVCGKKTGNYSMPWIAQTAWNDGKFMTTQGILF